MSEKSKLSYSWADECEGPGPYVEVDINHVNEIHKDLDDELKEKQNEHFGPFSKNYIDEKIIDKPENLNTKFIERENEYKKLNEICEYMDKKKEPEWNVVRKKKKSKCYTCHPRKKVLEHVIQKNPKVTFHHDICNRNIIVATPNKHYSSFEDISNEYVGILFKDIHKFCMDWNISDYSVSYNQGDWQTHKHFHVKIKTYDTTIKRLRGDHWRRQKLLNERKKEENAV